MKYIILDVGGIETPILFEEFLGHDFFVDFKHLIVSAGEFRLYGNEKVDPNAICAEPLIKVSSWGQSVGLKVKSRPEDEEIIRKAVIRHYYH